MNPIFILLLCLFIDLVGFGIVLPILPFIVKSFGGGEMVGGLLFGIYSGMAAICGPFWGRLSDHIGRKRALVLTLMGAGLSYLLLGFADSLIMVFVARAASGAMAGNVGVVMAALADVTTSDQRTRAMSFIGVSFGLGFATGPGLAAVLASVSEANALSLSAFAAAALSFAACILAMIGLRHIEPPQAEENEALDTQTSVARPGFVAFMNDRAKALLLMQFVIAASASSIVFSMSGFWANSVWGWGEKQVGYLMMGAGIITAVLQGFFVAPLAERYGENRTYMLALSSSALGCLLILSMPDVLPVVLFAFPMMMAGMTMSYPVLNSIVSQRNAGHVQGSALGLANGFAAVGRVIGPLLGGMLMARYSPGSPFLAALLLVALGMSWALSQIRQEADHHPKTR